MAMLVQHNLTAMNANRQLGINTTQKAKHTERLASGYRINRAADDAAGLAISEKMRSQIRGLAMGTRNTEEGISLCHVADGALNEVHAMINRLKELSVQAANGTNCESDRGMIQDEVEQILEEIDRIGNDTEFNTMPIFKGSTETVVEETDGLGSVPFNKFVLAKIGLDRPLEDGNNMNIMNLAAIVDDPTSNLNGESTRLIFNGGTTSNSSLRITVDGISSVVYLNGRTQTTDNGTWEFEPDVPAFSTGDTYFRKIYRLYNRDEDVTIQITQEIVVEETSETEKNYDISYRFSSLSSSGGDDKVDRMEFMFHADTAYNGNIAGDHAEGYYIGDNTNRLSNYCVYDTGTDLVGSSTSQYLYNETPPSSFKIYNETDPLQFCEKISFESGEEPDCLSIGEWDEVDAWDYYNRLDRELTEMPPVASTDLDLGFSLYYDLPGTFNSEVRFKYGICSEVPPPPIPPIPSDITTKHSEFLELWIQSGPNEGEGMYLTIGEMNTGVLGIRNLDVSTFEGAQEAITAVDIASQKVSSIRSVIGAQQNRLEHTVLYNENTLENTTAAESRIRDADMAEELVADAKYNILMQTSQAMLSQANNMTEGIVQLLNAT